MNVRTKLSSFLDLIIPCLAQVLRVYTERQRYTYKKANKDQKSLKHEANQKRKL